MSNSAKISDQTNIAVIGMGYWGKNLVRNFYELGTLRITCDSDEKCRDIVSDKYPDVAFSIDSKDVIADANVDAVVIATPAASHFELVRDALDGGKDVFVEKPLALNDSDGEVLVKLAEKRNRILMVGHILLFHPAVIRLSELIQQGELGQIRYFYSNRLNMGKIRKEENILWSFAPHDISVMLYLVGEEPCSVDCKGGAYINADVVDVTMSQFLFPSGIQGHIYVSWLHPFKEQRLVVVGSEKMAVFDDTADDKLIIYPHKIKWKKQIPTVVKADAESVSIEKAEPLRAECLHFLECISTRERPISDGKEALNVLRLLGRCQKSLEKGFPEYQRSPVKGRTGSENKQYFAHESAFIESGCSIGEGTKIWHFTHIMKNAQIGSNCVFGQNCNVDSDVIIGNNVKVQNNVSIYSGTVVENDVFLGPSCVLTNVANPRSQINRHSLYEKTLICLGSTIGANATIVCGVEIGRYAFVAAGAVVTKNVADYALVVGNPARQVGWMSRHGHRLTSPNTDGIMICPESGFRYRELRSGKLKCMDLEEEAALPHNLSKGSKPYRSFEQNKIIHKMDK